uniref:Uncharacterized protein n=1 Tax=Sphaerodactylus townsendi TaxID=933632 RepID=A0ACB8GFM5_9SAUR
MQLRIHIRGEDVRTLVTSGICNLSDVLFPLYNLPVPFNGSPSLWFSQSSKQERAIRQGNKTVLILQQLPLFAVLVNSERKVQMAAQITSGMTDLPPKICPLDPR